MTASITEPSAVLKMSDVGSRLIEMLPRRFCSMPAFNHAPALCESSEMAESSMATSMYWPLPVAVRW